MSRIRVFLIGRHQDCDLKLDDSSVSRCHAEVVLTADGRYFITDRNSTGGTFVHRGSVSDSDSASDSGWRPVRQAFIDPADRLRLGTCELPASRLESLRILNAGGGGGSIAGVAGVAGTAGVVGTAATAEAISPVPDDAPDPAKGLMRDPETGEIIEQS